MPFRRRTRTTTIPPQGSVKIWDSAGNGPLVSYSGAPLPKSSAVCEDVTGNFMGLNPFYLIDREVDIKPVNGAVYYPNGQIATSIENYPDSNSRFALNAHVGPGLGSYAGSNLAARMNPNKPLVDLPLFLFELKDIPQLAKQVTSLGSSFPTMMALVKRAGDSIIHGRRDDNAFEGVARHLGSVNLSYGFGWGPLLGDLLKIVEFNAAYERRQKQLKNLYSPRGLRRRVNVADGTWTSRSLVEADASTSCRLSFTEEYTTRARRWAVTRWKSTQNPPASRADLEWATIRTLMGLDISPSTLWNALPWSWMIDWALDIGDYLDSYRNTVPVVIQGNAVCVMSHWVTTCQRVNVKITPGYTGGTGYKRITEKYRVIAPISAFPSSIPFLDGRQVGVLASLSVAGPKAWRISR